MEDLILELAYIRISSKDQNPERQIKKFQDLKNLSAFAQRIGSLPEIQKAHASYE